MVKQQQGSSKQENFINELDLQRVRLRAAWLSFGIGILMLLMKMGGYLITNSAAVLSDALESVVHVIATGIALYSTVLIARPADRRHPYGYGKVEYFSAGAEGALIVAAAIAICYEAVMDLTRGNQLKDIDVGVWIVAAAGAINLLLGYYLIRTGKQTRSLVLEADGKHVLTDSFTSIGVLVGLLLVKLTGVVILDPLFAIAVALNILFTGYQLVRQSLNGLMNRVDTETLERTVAAVNKVRNPVMIDLHRLRAWRGGEQRFIDFHLTLPRYLPLHQTHELQHQLGDAIAAEFHNHAELLLHLDPCNNVLCRFCEVADCPIRHRPFTEKNEFTITGAVDIPVYQRGAR